MDEFTKKKFDALLQKDISALVLSDLIFLRARRDYLTPEQLEQYQPEFDTIDQRRKEIEAMKQEAIVTEPKQEEKKGKLYSDFSYKDLQKKGKEMGLKKVVGLSRDELIKQIDECYVL